MAVLGYARVSTNGQDLTAKWPSCKRPGRCVDELFKK